MDGCFAFLPASSRGSIRTTNRGAGLGSLCMSHDSSELPREKTTVPSQRTTRNGGVEPGISRRGALITAAAATTAALLPSLASAADYECLEDVALGDGRWARVTGSTMLETSQRIVPPSFATYATRFLLQYDKGVASWWAQSVQAYSLLSQEEQQAKLGRCFGSLAMSVQLALEEFLSQGRDLKQQSSDLAMLFEEKYGQEKDAKRNIGLLFSMLPVDHQPTTSIMKQFVTKTMNEAPQQLAGSAVSEESSQETSPLPSEMTNDFAALLPLKYESAFSKDTKSYAITPNLRLFEVGVDDEFGQAAVATAFGPVASSPLKRERPDYSLDIYTLFGISGATGCALTHTVVIPLDVVKTRMQTDPGQYSDILDGAVTIAKEEGPQGLLLGAQATVAGYMWYGLSVYPSYTFFKRLVGNVILSPEVATLHANDVALVAGAIAAVIASLGLTPLEACRIRTVADPDKYRPLGLLGTLDYISNEDVELGWKTLYAGLPSLMTRQVIFGSVKFLAFERACEAIFAFFPVLRDAVWTSLAVSLVAGGFSGALSSVVSQPADSVLTYVAQRSGGDGSNTLGVIEGCRIMMEEEGVGSLFRGLGSRCVWAGSIIAGQFLLYDVFRTYFGVNGDDLSQVFQVVISGSVSQA